MTERIITETYSRETRRNHYDQTARHVDDNISYGRSRLAKPVAQYDRYYSSYDQTANQLRHLTDLIYSLARDINKDKEPKSETKSQAKVPDEEIDELKKAIADLAAKITDIKEGKKKAKEEKDQAKTEKKEKRDKEMADLLASQKAIQDQLEEQKTMLKKIDTARQESDRVLRDDVSEALTEHKHLTDEALHHLAVKVSDLVSDNIALRKMVEELRKTLESIYVDDSDEEIKKYQKAQDSRRCTSASSCSVAVELPPAIVTDGRRPSQAYHMHTLALAEELADTSAKKALEEATRINISRM